MKKIKISSFSAILLLILVFAMSCNKPVIYDESSTDEGKLETVSRNKILTIVIPGARGSVIQEAKISNIRSLLSTSVYSWDSYAGSLTTDPASWTTLLTGAELEKTGVKGNSYLGYNSGDFPDLMTRLKHNDPGMNVSFINTFPSLNDTLISTENVDSYVQLQDDAKARDSAVSAIKRKESDFVFVTFRSINEAGKQGGYRVTSPKYMDAIEQTDEYIGDLLEALKSRPDYVNENWMIVITSTHGGTEEGTYGGDTDAERNTFVIYSIPGLPGAQIELPQVNVPYSGTYPYFATKSGEIGLAYSDDPSFKFGNNEDFTVEFLIKTTGSSSDNPIITNKNWGSGSNTGWLIYLESGNIRINYKGTDASRIDIRNGPAVDDNKWHRVSVVFNRKGGISIYHNGKFYLEGPTEIKDNGNVDTNYPLVIGNDGTRGYGGSLNCFLSEIRIWKSALSGELVDKWAFKPLAASHPAYGELVGYWKANDGETGRSSIKDFSPLKNDLQVPNILQWENLDEVLNPSNVDILSLVPNSVDYVTNVLAWTGIKIAPKWNLDGKVYIMK